MEGVWSNGHNWSLQGTTCIFNTKMIQSWDVTFHIRSVCKVQDKSNVLFKLHSSHVLSHFSKVSKLHNLFVFTSKYIISWITHHLIGSYLWPIEGQTQKWCHQQQPFSFSFIKYIHLVPCYYGSVNLESNRSQKTPKCLGLEYQRQTWPCYVQLSFLCSCFLPHFDITWDISLNIKLCTTTWHLFVKYIRFLCCILTQPPDVSCFFSASCYHSTFPNFNSS